MVFDFLKNLGRARVTGATSGAKGKAMGVQAKAKGKVAGKFNNAIDGAGKKAKGAASGGKKQKKQKKAKEKDGSMGLFGRKKQSADGGDGPPVQQEAEPEFGDKTQFIQVVQERPKECVGWVVALSGPLKGQDFRLVTGKNVMGTAADCDIVLTDQYMSARHAVLRHEDDNFVLVDLDSTNGTYVNGKRASKEELIDNDRVRLGRTEMKFKSLY